MVARAASLTHDLVVVRQDNGELAEDLMERSVADGGWLDAEISDSFPASDPLSHWAGPPRRTSDADRAHRALVQRRPADDTLLRTQAPGPGTPPTRG